jgi:hypothetical protein
VIPVKTANDAAGVDCGDGPSGSNRDGTKFQLEAVESPCFALFENPHENHLFKPFEIGALAFRPLGV